MGFVFYDTETTGTHTAFDQILQFAAIHTDAELNEIERFEVRCRILPHVVPSPGAMRVTGVPAAQLIDPSLPSHYEMVRLIREKFLAWSPAIFAGYNSIDFDEHLIRQALYKTLHSPYLTNSNGNARTDILSMVQAASLFAPEVLTLPTNANGKPVFKLDRVAPANGFNHANAHDALADVEATIFLARRIMERAPDIWSAFMRFSQKATVADFMTGETIFCLSDFYFGSPYAWLVTHLGQNDDKNAEHYVFDLSVDPESLVGLDDEALSARLGRSPKPVRRVKSNAAPILVPAEDAPAIAVATTLPPGECERRAEFIAGDAAFKARLIAALEAGREAREPSPHIEEQLYDGFLSQSDLVLCEQFHVAPWFGRPAIIERLQDQRLRSLGLRLIFCERPELLPASAIQNYNLAIARRLAAPEEGSPWLSLPNAAEEVAKFIAECDAGDAAFLEEHRAFLAERLEWALGLLK
jgi:exodeoxyribonuclease-1